LVAYAAQCPLSNGLLPPIPRLGPAHTRKCGLPTYPHPWCGLTRRSTHQVSLPRPGDTSCTTGASRAPRSPRTATAAGCQARRMAHCAGAAPSRSRHAACGRTRGGSLVHLGCRARAMQRRTSDAAQVARTAAACEPPLTRGRRLARLVGHLVRGVARGVGHAALLVLATRRRLVGLVLAPRQPVLDAAEQVVLLVLNVAARSVAALSMRRAAPHAREFVSGEQKLKLVRHGARAGSISVGPAHGLRGAGRSRAAGASGAGGAGGAGAHSAVSPALCLTLCAASPSLCLALLAACSTLWPALPTACLTLPARLCPVWSALSAARRAELSVLSAVRPAESRTPRAESLAESRTPRAESLMLSPAWAACPRARRPLNVVVTGMTRYATQALLLALGRDTGSAVDGSSGRQQRTAAARNLPARPAGARRRASQQDGDRRMPPTRLVLGAVAGVLERVDGLVRLVAGLVLPRASSRAALVSAPRAAPERRRGHALGLHPFAQQPALSTGCCGHGTPVARQPGATGCGTASAGAHRGLVQAVVGAVPGVGRGVPGLVALAAEPAARLVRLALGVARGAVGRVLHIVLVVLVHVLRLRTSRSPSANAVLSLRAARASRTEAHQRRVRRPPPRCSLTTLAALGAAGMAGRTL